MDEAVLADVEKGLVLGFDNVGGRVENPQLEISLAECCICVALGTDFLKQDQVEPRHSFDKPVQE